MSDTELEQAYRHWRECQALLQIAQDYLAEAQANGWAQHERWARDRINEYYEKEQRLYQEFLQLRGQGVTT